MAVPSSGELKLWDTIWNQEIGAAQGNNSLHGAAQYAGFSTPDAMSDFYGWSDVVPPSVSTQNPTSVATTSMTTNGNVSSTGGENPTRGFYFGTNSSSAQNNTKYSVGTGGTGAFSRSNGGLSSNTTYYNWAYACNSAGEAQGGRTQAATQPPPFTPTFSGLSQSYSCAYASSLSFNMAKVAGGYSNPYTGGGNNFAYCIAYAPYPQIATKTYDCRCAATNARNYRYGCASSATQGAGICVCHRVSAPSGFFNISSCGIQTSQGNNISGNCYAPDGQSAGPSGIQFCWTSDIRSKTNINYL